MDQTAEKQVEELLAKTNLGICEYTKQLVCLTCLEEKKTAVFTFSTMAKHVRANHKLVFAEKKLKTLLDVCDPSKLSYTLPECQLGVKCDSCEYDTSNFFISFLVLFLLPNMLTKITNASMAGSCWLPTWC